MQAQLKELQLTYTTIASLKVIKKASEAAKQEYEVIRVELSAKMANLKEELSLEREQLRKAKGVNASLKLANKKLEAHVSSLNM